MGMLTPDEGEGLQQVVENLVPQGGGDKGLLGDLFSGGSQSGVSADFSDGLSYHQACKGDVSSLLPGVDIDFSAGGGFDMLPGGDGSSSMLPGGDGSISTINTGLTADKTMTLDAGGGGTTHNLVSGDGGITGTAAAPSPEAGMLSGAGPSPDGSMLPGAGPSPDVSMLPGAGPAPDVGMLPGAGASPDISMLPGADAPGALGGMQGGIESMSGAISKMMGEMLGSGTPMGFLGQLMEFLMNLFSPEALGELGHVAAQAAESSANELAKLKKA